MPSPIPEDFAPELSTQLIIVVPMVNLSAMYFVYRFYTLLFGTCIHMLRSRQQGDERVNWNLYLLLTVVLFVFSTAFVVIYTIDMVYRSITYFTAVKTQDYEVLVNFWMHVESFIVL
uniref:Uncharacterized protein n=1 Tax=Moniliophthora roreri TaxID=221103 RepID=A0A0W0F6F0_MONRR